MFSFVEPHADVSVHCHLYSYGLVSTHEHKYAWRMRRCREDKVSVVCRNEHGQIDEKFRLSRIDQLGFRAGLVCHCLPASAAANGAALLEGREDRASQRKQAIGWLMATDTAEVGRKADRAADVGEHPFRGGVPVENVGLACLTTPGHGCSGSTTIRTRSIAGFQRP